ncbi:TATA box-binding protein-like protein 1 [Trichinella patagoniensis]|uniref:TATA box-binding protein-like protein 1 n=1 Tax=Trichinella patagoniensis TaxID=990121 RepID=A0A0V0ZQV1_9BILA|nr:TATA box-binding protein-like protein 1 [Trichinella patagoniensis]
MHQLASFVLKCRNLLKIYNSNQNKLHVKQIHQMNTPEDGALELSKSAQNVVLKHRYDTFKHHHELFPIIKLYLHISYCLTLSGTGLEDYELFSLKYELKNNNYLYNLLFINV